MESLRLTPISPGVEFCVESPFAWAHGAAGLIEKCGRVSHRSEGRAGPGTAIPFIRKVAIAWGHESILEHASLTVCFTCSRAASHQLVRHRIGAYTQESQRYCDYSDGAKHPSLRVIVPPSMGVGDSLIRASYLGAVQHAYASYLALREAGVPAEDTRYLLPNAAATAVYTTYNLRQWRHFLRMRLDKHAQWEIKLLAGHVWRFFDTHLPILLENLKTHSGEVPFVP